MAPRQCYPALCVHCCEFFHATLEFSSHFASEQYSDGYLIVEPAAQLHIDQNHILLGA